MQRVRFTCLSEMFSCKFPIRRTSHSSFATSSRYPKPSTTLSLSNWSTDIGRPSISSLCNWRMFRCYTTSEHPLQKDVGIGWGWYGARVWLVNRARKSSNLKSWWWKALRAIVWGLSCSSAAYYVLYPIRKDATVLRDRLGHCLTGRLSSLPASHAY
jgi:hypothetical protein